MTYGWFRVKLLALVAIALGILLRFSHLDHKVYWHDEVFTSLRIAGYLGPQVNAQLFTNRTITAGELLQYQQFPVDASLARTWTSLVDHPEHPPLYYLMTYSWGRWWGASVAGYRAIAALFGVLALPLMYWLGRELFPTNPAVAWIAVVLLSISPVHVIYSQEAREYSLWVVGMLLANLALLRALRLDTRAVWLGYGVAIALSWYGSLVTALLGLSHLVFVGLTQRPRQWLAFALAFVLGLGLFAPWLWVVGQQWQRLQTVTAWTREPSPLAFLTKLWGLHYSATVADFNLPLDHWFTWLGPLLLLGLVALALVHVWRHYGRETGLFLTSLLLISPLVLIGSDLIRSGKISGTTRYFFPSLIAVPLLLAPWIADLLAASKPLAKTLGRLTLASLLILGITSVGTNLRAPAWWNKSISYPNPFIAAYLNTVPDPLVIFGPNSNALGEAISLSYDLKPTTVLWLLADKQMPPTLPEPKTPFLFKPDGPLQTSAQSHWQMTPVEEAEGFAGPNLIKLTPIP
ncbi:MAG: hypothetical protein HC929_13550 [Leptolyngbyaceae cyanobacterium SM2_5_2]|nr:hypothetical protein [Leptolyngbyaceae cyanobacterium SM2_5_2]